jgi:DNA-binding XRE family transcriptional regulator
MDRKKKARLQSAGWAVGSAKDFLGLSEAESALIELKLGLSRLHRERRERAGLSQQALAKRLHSSQSRVAKMEAGDPSVSMDLLVRSLIVLGTPGGSLAQTIGSGRQTRSSSIRR